MNDTDALLLGGIRTPFSRFGGALRSVSSVNLAAFAMRQALESTGVAADQVAEVYDGVSMPSEEALDGSIPARVAMLRAGLPEDTLSLTLDRACCSSMTAIQLAARAIRGGEADVILAGGAENMGRAAFLMSPEIRWGFRRGELALKDPLASPGEDTDDWALGSHQRYFGALRAGFYDDEIVPFDDGSARLDHDEGPRPDSSAEKLAQLKPVLGSPIVTPGNAPGLDTGACFVVVVSRRYAARHGLAALARIVSAGSVARAPREIAVAPAPALQRALSPLGLEAATLARIEINEAFACVPLVSARVLADGDAQRERKILNKTNVNGGAVAIGHPTGASGARLTLTLARELRRLGGGRGGAAICGGLGQADALVLETE